MRAVAAFVALPRDDRLLLLEAIWTVAVVRIALRFVPVQRLRAWASRMKPGTRRVDRIAWAAGVASRRLPRTTCLMSALALQRLLSTQGHASELHIGVARENEEFTAHAWLSCDGVILMGGLEHDRFTWLVDWHAGAPSQRAGAGLSESA